MEQLLTDGQMRVVRHAILTGTPIVVDGEHGPTGKTTLCEKLRRRGAIAWEPWEVEEGFVVPDIFDGENTVFLTVRLNKPLAHLK